VDGDFKRGLISALLIFVVLISLIIIAAPVSAPNVSVPPSCNNPYLPLPPVQVPAGKVFLLRGSITFDQPETGYFIWGPLGWYHNGDPTENFSLENTPSVYWTDGTPVENVSIGEGESASSHHIDIRDNGSGIARNGTFYIDIWLRAASGDGTPHKVDNQWIYFAMDMIWLWEPTPWWPDPILIPAGPIYVDVIGWTGTATFKLENMYKVSLEKDLQLYAGRKLVVKFHKYDNTFQAENVLHNFTPRENVKENENASHPRRAERFSWGTVQIARLVLTTENENEVISEIASFTVHQSHLKTRFIGILGLWFLNPDKHDAFRAEVKDILSQWFPAPP